MTRPGHRRPLTILGIAGTWSCMVKRHPAIAASQRHERALENAGQDPRKANRLRLIPPLSNAVPGHYSSPPCIHLAASPSGSFITRQWVIPNAEQLDTDARGHARLLFLAFLTTSTFGTSILGSPLCFCDLSTDHDQRPLSKLRLHSSSRLNGTCQKHQKQHGSLVPPSTSRKDITTKIITELSLEAALFVYQSLQRYVLRIKNYQLIG